MRSKFRIYSSIVGLSSEFLDFNMFFLDTLILQWVEAYMYKLQVSRIRNNYAAHLLNAYKNKFNTFKYNKHLIS